MSLNIVRKIDGPVKIRHVLISVTDKTGLDELAGGLIAVNPEVKIFSTGGTFDKLKSILGADYARNLTQVSDYTGQPETQGGLVKTLDFKIYLGLLTETYNEAHQGDLKRTGAVPIDLVVVNLYNFELAAGEAGTTLEEARTNIDIGGPCMIRAAAKNFLRTAPVVDPADYRSIIAELMANDGMLSVGRRFELARKAFAHTARYDGAIAAHLAGRNPAEIAEIYELVNK